MSNPVNIIAVGGGGFTHATDSELEDYIFQQLSVTNPSIGFIPTASGDSDIKISRFYERFNQFDCQSSHLNLFGTVKELEKWILSQDLIYVGGGNTKSMLGVWREWDLPRLLLKAAHNSTVLSGVSAGAVCWFDTALSDSGGEGLAALPALAFVGGSCCPHYSTEVHRRECFADFILSGLLPSGIAIDDGVAVQIRDGVVVGGVSAREGACAYHLAKVADRLEINTIVF